METERERERVGGRGGGGGAREREKERMKEKVIEMGMVRKQGGGLDLTGMNAKVLTASLHTNS